MSLDQKLKPGVKNLSIPGMLLVSSLGLWVVFQVLALLFPILEPWALSLLAAAAGGAFFCSLFTLSKKIAKKEKARQIVKMESKSLETLQKNTAFYQKILNTNPHLIYIKDQEGKFQLSNRAFAEFHGSTNAEILAQKDKELSKSIKEYETIHKTDLNVINTQKDTLIQEEVLTDHQGKRRTFNTIKTPIQTPQSHELSILSVSTDISNLKRCREKLSFERMHDPLTGLPNQAHLSNCLELVQQNDEIDQLYAVLLLDIDHFKRVNNGLGYLVGDQLLICAAERLASCIRSSDTIARLKGDEFAILLQDINEVKEVYQVVDRIFEKLSVPFFIDGNEVQLSASIGIVFGNDYDCTENDLLLDADIAMGHAKLLGKARYVVFNEAMRTSKEIKLKMETDLRHALENQELRVYYQPIVNLDSKQVTGMEALLRWEHPIKGLTSPIEFIPLAEETELIIPIGLWVLEEACKQTKTWQEKYTHEQPLTISVNISSTQLLDKNFVFEAAEILQKTGLNPHHLKLEITESVYLENSPEVIQVLNQLNELGVQLFIDDFGTGYSSLAYLRQLPFDAIKIDRSFISGISGENGGTKIVQAIVRLARDLGKELIAEGVETEEQRKKLRNMGCDYEQGFLFSRPVAPAQIEKFL